MFLEQKRVRNYSIPININKLNKLYKEYTSYNKDIYLPEIILK
jgi:hypothetical protein